MNSFLYKGFVFSRISGDSQKKTVTTFKRCPAVPFAVSRRFKKKPRWSMWMNDNRWFTKAPPDVPWNKDLLPRSFGRPPGECITWGLVVDSHFWASFFGEKNCIEKHPQVQGFGLSVLGDLEVTWQFVCCAFFMTKFGEDAFTWSKSRSITCWRSSGSSIEYVHCTSWI